MRLLHESEAIEEFHGIHDNAWSPAYLQFILLL